MVRVNSQTIEINTITKSEMSDEEIIKDIEDNFITISSKNDIVTDIENIFYKTNDRVTGLIMIPMKGFINMSYLEHKIVEVVELRGASVAINKTVGNLFSIHGECISAVTKYDYSNVSEADYRKALLETIKDGHINCDLLKKMYYYILMCWSTHYKKPWNTLKKQTSSEMDEKIVNYYLRLLGSFG